MSDITDQYGHSTASAIADADHRLADDQVITESGADKITADPNVILQGSALLGRAAWSAGRMEMSPIAVYEREVQKLHDREAQEALEMAHLQEWNAQMTSVGGVAMTNEEAQGSRRRVLENADAHVDRAIASGELSEGDRAEFKRWMARKIELEEKRGRGTITEAEAKEEAEGDRTRVGHAADVSTGMDHQMNGAAPAATASATATNAAVRGSSSQALADYDAFQAKAAAADRDGRATVSPVAAKVLATGLNL